MTTVVPDTAQCSGNRGVTYCEAYPCVARDHTDIVQFALSPDTFIYDPVSLGLPLSECTPSPAVVYDVYDASSDLDIRCHPAQLAAIKTREICEGGDVNPHLALAGTRRRGGNQTMHNSHRGVRSIQSDAAIPPAHKCGP